MRTLAGLYLVSCLCGGCGSRGPARPAPVQPPSRPAATSVSVVCPPRIMTRQYGSPAAGGHSGVDFTVCEGERIVAIADGHIDGVVEGEVDEDKGGIIAITRDIDGSHVLLLYAHVANIQVVDDQLVTRGQVLGDAWQPSSDRRRAKWQRHVHLEKVGREWEWDPLKILGGCASRGVSSRPIYPVSC